MKITAKELKITSGEFNPYEEDWDTLEINIRNDKKSCFINRIISKSYIIKRILLSDKERVKIYCSWDFYPSSKTGKFIPRPTFYKTNNDDTIKETSKNKVRIELDEGDLPIKFWEMIDFLSRYKDLIDLGEFGKKYRVVSDEQLIDTLNSYNTDKQLRTIKEFIKDKNLTYKQLESLLDTSKIKSLQQFKIMLEKETVESDWQKFFEENIWIFAGISLKLFFAEDIIPQADVGISNSQGKGSPNVDILCIDDYATIVELKRPDTHIFKLNHSSTSRTNTWAFSSDFVDGISQCLAQKQDLIENYKFKEFNNRKGDTIKVRAKDPKTIFIIGNKSKEFSHKDTKPIEKIKSQTFELFRRNCKNIEIITYDELYNRASHIVDSIMSHSKIKWRSYGC